jgi:hypothetical protein
MNITFTRRAGGSTLAVLKRRDGVVVELPGYDRKFRVPHDLAHAVAERELGMPGGVFGSIAGGVVFGNMRVVGGKPRHDSADRSKRLLAANKTSIGIAEVMAGVLHHAVEHEQPGTACEHAKRSWGVFSAEPVPWSADQLAAAVRLLAELTMRFERDGTLEFAWPDRLTSEVPPAAGAKRSRRGRI